MNKFSLTFSCVGALVILVMVPSETQAMTEEMELKWQKSMKRDIELGLLAVEPPPKEEPASVFIQDPAFQAEEDRDHLHHPRHVPQRFQKQERKVEIRQISNEPEEDRDHLYHK